MNRKGAVYYEWMFNKGKMTKSCLSVRPHVPSLLVVLVGDSACVEMALFMCEGVVPG